MEKGDDVALNNDYDVDLISAIPPTSNLEERFSSKTKNQFDTINYGTVHYYNSSLIIIVIMVTIL